jgi:outer membrane immunogenic protein
MVTGRVGHTWGRALFYGKGGLAFGEVRVETSQNAGAAVPPSGTPVNGETKWLTGWTVGGGMEFALSDRWSARAEYMHYDLGSANFNIDNGFVADAATRGETVRLGASYHFHRPEPVPLK